MSEDEWSVRRFKTNEEGEWIEEPKPQGIWLALINGKYFSHALKREDINLRNISERDPRLSLKYYVESTP